jgi:hypothetical protein
LVGIEEYERLSLLADHVEAIGVRRGLADVEAGRTCSLEEA